MYASVEEVVNAQGVPPLDPEFGLSKPRCRAARRIYSRPKRNPSLRRTSHSSLDSSLPGASQHRPNHHKTCREWESVT